jgi:metal-responsive CopG/Arc/MetJ family transcriptional regulator
MSTTKVKLDQELVEKAKKFAEVAGYSSVEEFITHTLESAMEELEEASDTEELKERLKGLGYIA